MSDPHRISVTLPDDLREQFEELKKNKYYHLSYSELYRQALAAGINAIKGEPYQNKKTILSKGQK